MSPLVVLIVAVLATTYAGPIVRLAAAPAVAIAFWRLVLVLPVTFGVATRERQPTRAVREAFPLMLLSGLLLATHFWTWIASLKFTSVASSVLLVSLKPVFAWAVAALWLGEHPGRTERRGIALAVAGATLIGLGDARLSLGAAGGDALALAGALTGAGYYVIGRRVRRTVGVWNYASVVYAVAAVSLGFVAALRDAPLTEFGRRDWAVFAALAAGPMLVGHTGMNYALKRYRATTVHVAVVDAAGKLVAKVGDPDLVTYWRSAAKPFQALPLAADGVLERFAITTEQLALCCASHSSEPQHVAIVRDLLRKIECSERDLLCGPHPPLSETVARDYASRGVRLTAIYSNCSGKHAGMLALARHHGWPTDFYTRVEHPVQRRCLEEVSRWTDVAVPDIKTAVDGCGVVCYGLPLRQMALAYARLAIADF